jgi:hypothetical protein
MSDPQTQLYAAIEEAQRVDQKKREAAEALSGTTARIRDGQLSRPATADKAYTSSLRSGAGSL